MFSNKCLTFVGLFFLASFALATDSITWNIDGEEHSIYFDEDLQIMLSASCEKLECGARKLAKEARAIKIDSSEEGIVTNPGSKYCQKLKGVVVIGINARGSQNAFCQASDETIVDLSSLGAN